MAGQRDRLTGAAYGLGWAVVKWVPESWARAVFMLGAEIAWRRQGHGVQVLEGNLRRVVPDADGKRLRALSRAVLRSYARYWMESFRLPVIGTERILADFRATGENGIHENMAAGRGVVLALPHMANYDLAGAWIIARGVGSFATVVEHLKPESLFRQFVAFREGLGMEVLPASRGPSTVGVLAQRLRAGKLVCIVSDRDVTGGGVEVEFFGEKARMGASPAALAVQTGAALMPVVLWFDGPRWGAHIHEEIPVPAEGTRREKVAELSQRLAEVFEAGIAEHPQDWHMLQRLFVADLDADRLPAVDASAPSAPLEPESR